MSGDLRKPTWDEVQTCERVLLYNREKLRSELRSEHASLIERLRAANNPDTPIAISEALILFSQIDAKIKIELERASDIEHLFDEGGIALIRARELAWEYAQLARVLCYETVRSSE